MTAKDKYLIVTSLIGMNKLVSMVVFRPSFNSITVKYHYIVTLKV